MLILLILLPIFSFIIVYFFLPEILLHLLGVGFWKRQYSPGVSITFDDGPDPEYTPILLDILAQQSIIACFFLVGKKVEENPDIAKMIYEKGHQIGSHGYIHKHAWLLSPKRTWEYWDKSISVIQRITGQEPNYIRPPWGGVSLSLFLWSIAKKKRIVGWNAKGKDWAINRCSSEIINTVLKHTSEGTIILLHDSGGEQGAPANTLLCLDELFFRINKVLKLPIVPLEFPEWSIARRIFYRIWEKWEYIYARKNNIKRIDDHNLFRLSLSRYKGPDLINENGQLAATKGDMIGEIHFDNIRFQSIGKNLENVGVKALKLVRKSLPTLAKYILINPEYKNIKVFLGITMLNKGAKGLGFHVQDYPNNTGLLIGLLQKILMNIYHPAGMKRKTNSLGSKPKLVWISKDKLIEKYINEERVIS